MSDFFPLERKIQLVANTRDTIKYPGKLPRVGRNNPPQDYPSSHKQFRTTFREIRFEHVVKNRSGAINAISAASNLSSLLRYC